MSASTAHRAVDLAPATRARPGVALALALLSIPGVTVAWDISAFVACVGVAIGIAAIVIGLQARARLAGAKGTRMATIAVAIGSLGVLSVVFFLLVGAPD